MKRLVDDLLDVSRITSGRVQLQKSLVDAGEIVTRVAEANEVLFSSRGHTLHLKLPREEVYARGRSVSLGASLVEFACEFREVHRSGRQDLVQRRSRRPGCCVSREGLRNWNRPRPVAQRVRLVCPGESVAASGRRRTGHRSDDRPRADGVARRPGLGDERRFRSRRGVRAFRFRH